ncbi:hypothetical protein [Luteibacter sp. 3190]|uniref:hypothetical protein n=1 Tax=Luteibacter sp. 3190 TaxID=2817736 RepID=UPI00285A49BE|nr:hypothetical protein [Luteibacter sp. 3190]MDR6935473.1 hypothetical protein [Luteibacter sp. 3190]
MNDKKSHPALFPPSYWDRITTSPGEPVDASVDQIFHAVGFALTAWELAESALAALFLVVSNVTDANGVNAIRRAFGSVESSAGRRRALKAAAEIYFGNYWSEPRFRKPFDQLTKAFEGGSSRRDEIAHGVAYPMSIDGKAVGAFLYPAEYNTERTLPWIASLDDPFAITRARYRYSSAAIYEYAKRFSELSNKVWEYAASIRKVNGVPAVVLDAQLGEGSATMVEAMLAQQEKDKLEASRG